MTHITLKEICNEIFTVNIFIPRVISSISWQYLEFELFFENSAKITAAEEVPFSADQIFKAKFKKKYFVVLKNFIIGK